MNSILQILVKLVPLFTYVSLYAMEQPELEITKLSNQYFAYLKDGKHREALEMHIKSDIDAISTKDFIKRYSPTIAYSEILFSKSCDHKVITSLFTKEQASAEVETSCPDVVKIAQDFIDFLKKSNIDIKKINEREMEKMGMDFYNQKKDKYKKITKNVFVNFSRENHKWKIYSNISKQESKWKKRKNAENNCNKAFDLSRQNKHKEALELAERTISLSKEKLVLCKSVIKLSKTHLRK